MNKSIPFALLFVCCAQSNAQFLNQDLPNSFTFQSVVPHGCLVIVPAVDAAPPDEVFADQQILVQDDGLSGVVQIRAWRIGCHEPNASAIMLNFSLLSGSQSVPYPMVELVTADEVGRPAGLFAFGRQQFHPPRGASLTPMTDQSLPGLVEGFSFVVDADAGSIRKQEYNAALLMRLRWPSGQQTEIAVPAYDELLDAPQFTTARLHGRYSGQWVIDGMPRQGLVLQIGELPPDRNFLFLSMFTYLSGQPTWVVGNTDFAVGTPEVTVNMWALEGGEFFTGPLGSYTNDDVEQVLLGTMTLRPLHCNIIDAEIDFSRAGLGVVNRRFERLIRIAGYDCDQTR